MRRNQQRPQTWPAAMESLPSLYQADDAVTSGIRPPTAPPEVEEAVSGEVDVASLDPAAAELATASLEEPTLDPPQPPPRGVERRHFERRPFHEAFGMTINGEQLEIEGIDIGRGGLQCAPLPSWARRGDPVLLHLPEPHRQVLGRVAWVRPRSRIETEKVAGIRFSSPLPFLH